MDLNQLMSGGVALFGEDMTLRHTALVFLLLVLTTPACGSQPAVPEDPPPIEGKLEIKEISLGPMAPSEDGIVVSPDQKRVAFKGGKDGKEFIVVDGKKSEGYDEVSAPSFSSDSQHVSYWARRNGLKFIVVDGVEGKGYETSKLGFIISPDSKRVATIVYRENGAMVVLDGVEGKLYRSIKTETSPTFSPDSKRFMHTVDVGEKQSAVVVDGVEGNAYDSVDNAQFSPDSRRVSV